MSGGVFILLPVLNEAATIEPLLHGIKLELSELPSTVGILDDGSTDGTLEKLSAIARHGDQPIQVLRRKKTGLGSQRGSALRDLMLWGLENTDHQVFVEMDGDLSHRPEELARGIKAIATGSCDVAIASKYVEGSAVVNRPWSRRCVSRTCSYAVRALIDPRVRDYSNGYRFYSRRAAEVAASYEYRYGSPIYLSEILALWMRAGLTVAEFKTVYVGRNEGISKLRPADLLKAAVAIFEIAWRYHVTGFKPLASARSPARALKQGTR